MLSGYILKKKKLILCIYHEIYVFQNIQKRMNIKDAPQKVKMTACCFTTVKI